MLTRFRMNWPGSSTFEENVERERALAPAMAALSRHLRTPRSPSTLAAGTAGLGSAGHLDAAWQLLQHGFQPQEWPSEVSTESMNTEPRKRRCKEPSCMPRAVVMRVMMSSSNHTSARASIAQHDSERTSINRPERQVQHVKMALWWALFECGWLSDTREHHTCSCSSRVAARRPHPWPSPRPPRGPAPGAAAPYAATRPSEMMAPKLAGHVPTCHRPGARRWPAAEQRHSRRSARALNLRGEL